MNKPSKRKFAPVHNLGHPHMRLTTNIFFCYLLEEEIDVDFCGSSLTFP